MLRTEMGTWVLISVVHCPCCAGTRNLAKEGSGARVPQVEEKFYFVWSGKRGLLLG